MLLKAKAYSSSANLGPGYDVLAMAIDLFYDEVVLNIENSSIIDVKTISVHGPYSNYVPLRENTAMVAAREFLKRYEIKAKVELNIWKNIPVGKGLGSSGATAAATVAALAKAFNVNDENELVDIAAEGEKASAGSPHPDNVAASLLGGIVLIHNRKPLRVVKIPLKKKPKLIIIIPKTSFVKEKTKYARSLLPKTVPMEKVVFNTGKIAVLITGFTTGNLRLAGEGMEDAIVESARKPILPLYFEIKRTLKNKGALGVCVSGAGPSILVMFDQEFPKNKIDEVKNYISNFYGEKGFNVEIYDVRIAEGAKVEILEEDKKFFFKKR